MPASISTTAGIAARCCGRSRAIAACFAHMAMCPVRQSRKSAQVAKLHRAAAGRVQPEGRGSGSAASLTDWAGDRRTFVLLWCLPAAAMILAAYFGPLLRAGIWTAMLLLMGGACLANARRCNRTHCRFTGPVLILMAAGVVAYANGLLRLGPHGWSILGSIIVVGVIGIWWASERAFGKFMR